MTAGQAGGAGRSRASAASTRRAARRGSPSSAARAVTAALLVGSAPPVAGVGVERRGAGFSSPRSSRISIRRSASSSRAWQKRDSCTPRSYSSSDVSSGRSPSSSFLTIVLELGDGGFEVLDGGIHSAESSVLVPVQRSLQMPDAAVCDRLQTSADAADRATSAAACSTLVLTRTSDSPLLSGVDPHVRALHPGASRRG